MVFNFLFIGGEKEAAGSSFIKGVRTLLKTVYDARFHSKGRR